MPKVKVFLCWSKPLSKLVAESFRDWIEDQMGDCIQPFYSNKDIQPGERWSFRLLDELKQSNRALAFFTREMANAPWVIYESGALSKQFASSSVIPVLVDIGASELPPPLQTIQGVALECDKLFNVLLKWAPKIAKVSARRTKVKAEFTKWFSTLKQKIDVHSNESLTGGDGDWTQVSNATVASATARSPFKATDALRVAKHKVIFVGQNLYSLVKGNFSHNNHMGLWDDIKRALQRSIDVEVMVMNNAKENNAPIRGWMKTQGEDFQQHLNDVVKRLKEWSKWSKHKSLSGRLSIKLANFIPPSMTLVDPEHATGKLFLVTSIAKEVKSGPRPVFMISKSDSSNVFDYYYEAYRDLSVVPRSIKTGKIPQVVDI